ncbi:D-arabinono-1,4-lactone oxidase [Recurvomyces mirabilis]|uniref:D-arabinono-1,4-lactone oxidase n=1 Tax=Recurvomyces mirabilis TaxID=574656 RepID=A0AAE0TNT9_9PEZI|nr:D-arabinono-1,4-lactone oxidase [Recurvomyces mirabilis]KAK5161034.1 D-arabinono-1,4-lactone oxidase [Recurvomyces mirabilis]
MERIQHEIAKTDPDVPFRALTTHIHYTWAKTFSSRPELYIKPQTLQEVQKVINLARKCRRRIVVVGCGHSPSILTCTSSWMVNLDDYSKVLKVDKAKKTLLVEGGIRLRKLNEEANRHGMTMPNLGSIDEQSIVGAISTATHGSTLKHGLMSESVKSLRIVLANGQAVRCSAEQNQELFRAALVSLGALGIIVEVEFEMTDACNIEWTQTLEPLSKILNTWETTLWTQKEFTRVWWMPYMKRAIVWSAEETEKPERAPESNFYGGALGFHTYHNLLWLSNYIPSILPWVEWFVFGMQYGWQTGVTTSAVEPLRSGLLMNCLYSQFVNEWALDLAKGPEAINRLSAWINREGDNGRIPFDNGGLYVHCPIEVRVSDTSRHEPRPFLDNTYAHGPTLYLNATLYRPYLKDPPCHYRYYEAFEWLMRELDAKPHYAKNFQFTGSEYMTKAFGENLQKWTQVRNEADPEGMFLGEWHRQTLGLGEEKAFALSEQENDRKPFKPGSCILWSGSLSSAPATSSIVNEKEPGPTQMRAAPDSPSASSSGESFDMMHGSEAEKSILYNGDEEDDDGDETDRDEKRYHGRPTSGLDGTRPFDKM